MAEQPLIVVTGASRGLGRRVAERLAAQGLRVLGLARQVDGLPFDARSCDVADAASVQAVAQALKQAKLPLAALINAAGIASMNLALATPAATARRIVETNLLGTIYCCQQFAPLMLRQRSGRIVNFSTIAVPLALKGEAVYAASKAGVESFTRTFAREVADFGVTVNCIAPGPVATDLTRGVPAPQLAAIVEQQIQRRAFTPDDIADLVEWLLDPRARHISGQVLHAGGA